MFLQKKKIEPLIKVILEVCKVWLRTIYYTHFLQNIHVFRVNNELTLKDCIIYCPMYDSIVLNTIKPKIQCTVMLSHSKVQHTVL